MINTDRAEQPLKNCNHSTLPKAIPAFPTPATDRAAAIAAMADDSPFAVAFRRELGDDRIDAIVAWAMTGGAK